MDAIIKITGVQGFMQPDADTIEFVTDGSYSRTDGGYRISYRESELTGMDGTVTSVYVEDDGVTVVRKGVLNSVMEFREGLKNRVLYDTQFGAATLGIETRRVSSRFDERGGELSIDYVVNMEHAIASRNTLNMSVKLRS